MKVSPSEKLRLLMLDFFVNGLSSGRIAGYDVTSAHTKSASDHISDFIKARSPKEGSDLSEIVISKTNWLYPFLEPLCEHLNEYVNVLYKLDNALQDQYNYQHNGRQSPTITTYMSDLLKNSQPQSFLNTLDGVEPVSMELEDKCDHPIRGIIKRCLKNVPGGEQIADTIFLRIVNTLLVDLASGEIAPENYADHFVNTVKQIIEQHIRSAIQNVTYFVISLAKQYNCDLLQHPNFLKPQLEERNHTVVHYIFFQAVLLAYFENELQPPFSTVDIINQQPPSHFSEILNQLFFCDYMTHPKAVTEQLSSQTETSMFQQKHMLFNSNAITTFGFLIPEYFRYQPSFAGTQPCDDYQGLTLLERAAEEITEICNDKNGIASVLKALNIILNSPRQTLLRLWFPGRYGVENAVNDVLPYHQLRTLPCMIETLKHLATLEAYKAASPEAAETYDCIARQYIDNIVIHYCPRNDVLVESPGSAATAPFPATQAETSTAVEMDVEGATQACTMTTDVDEMSLKLFVIHKGIFKKKNESAKKRSAEKAPGDAPVTSKMQKRRSNENASSTNSRAVTVSITPAAMRR